MAQRRYVHSRTNGEHLGINYAIQEDGKIIIDNHKDDDDEHDEITIPASLVFKLAKILEATRKVHWVDEVKG